MRVYFRRAGRSTTWHRPSSAIVRSCNCIWRWPTCRPGRASRGTEPTARRPHYHDDFTPTPASWIHPIERWFAELTRKQIQRDVHTPVRQFEADIRIFIELHNNNPKPFQWTKSADQILAFVKSFCHKAQQTLCGEL